jgi:hypothetical protein
LGANDANDASSATREEPEALEKQVMDASARSSANAAEALLRDPIRQLP